MSPFWVVVGWALVIPVPWLIGAIVAVRIDSRILGPTSRAGGWWAVLVGSGVELLLLGLGLTARLLVLWVPPDPTPPDPYMGPGDLLYMAAVGLGILLGFLIRCVGIGWVLWGFRGVVATDRHAIADGREVA